MRRQLLTLVLSIPLLASGAAGVVLHVCQSMGGQVIGDCDCDEKNEHAEHAEHTEHADHSKAAHHSAHEDAAKLQPQPCCTIELSSASQALATQELARPDIAQASLASVSLHDNSILSSRQACGHGLLRERSPPNVHGPPIFLRHCSFLN